MFLLIDEHSVEEDSLYLVFRRLLYRIQEDMSNSHQPVRLCLLLTLSNAVTSDGLFK